MSLNFTVTVPDIHKKIVKLESVSTSYSVIPKILQHTATIPTPIVKIIKIYP